MPASRKSSVAGDRLKKYARPTGIYESKLGRVMKRLDISVYEWNHDRYEAWVQFRYKGNLYRFSKSVRNGDLKYGSDCFAQIVLGLEDLARLVKRGIYDLQTWIAGFKALPEHVELPSCLRFFGFTEVPSVDKVHDEYRKKALLLHPDSGGSADDFDKLTRAYEQALAFVGGK